MISQGKIVVVSEPVNATTKANLTVIVIKINKSGQVGQNDLI